ncbi:MAG: hypothetical protein OEY48_05250 [Gammaproteobacteria bacterium]|nr:hypothetical protein [Gammaproteobacteria bacterium]MDH5592237.1 hypothetical protein [Gammaproteobacteria bacterium]
MTDQSSTEQSDQIIRFDSRGEAKSLALQLAQQARREICFFGNSLDPVMFDNTEFIDCISEFARRNQKTSVKFAVHSTQQNVVDGHRLIALAQRLTSAFHIHKTAVQHQDLPEMFLLVDDHAYLHCLNYQRHEGRASFNSPLEVRSMKQKFNDIWNHSTADISTRRLHI